LSVVGTERLLESGFFRGEARPGEPDQGILEALHNRSRDAVLRVREGDRRLFQPRQPGTPAFCAYPTDGRR
jgi:hypothetical protein